MHLDFDVPQGGNGNCQGNGNGDADGNGQHHSGNAEGNGSDGGRLTARHCRRSSRSRRRRDGPTSRSVTSLRKCSESCRTSSTSVKHRRLSSICKEATMIEEQTTARSWTSILRISSRKSRREAAPICFAFRTDSTSITLYFLIVVSLRPPPCLHAADCKMITV